MDLGLDEDIPADFEHHVLQQFDSLRSRSLLIYDEPVIEYISENDFLFEFRTSPALKTKPILAPNDPGRSKRGGPFSDPEPEFIVAKLGTTHLLQLSKYCMSRPLLILHPIEYARQVEDLDQVDIKFAWSLLNGIKTAQVVLFNCGFEAGSSQGHKHLQIFPEPGETFTLFPDREVMLDFQIVDPTCVTHIPYVHWLVRIPKEATPDVVYEQYWKSLTKTKSNLPNMGNASAYNVLFTRRWLIIITRLARGYKDLGINGAGMLGMVWVKDMDERKEWDVMGLTEHIRIAGIPNGRTASPEAIMT